ncbi:MAG: hypothetical protein GYA36_23020 [Veillonellaceae bacterium]|nr:hypothetical protein [Veillonellaceae bacterium]
MAERRLEIGAGLGDTLATLPAAYALAAKGVKVEIAALQPGGGVKWRTDSLPTLKVFGNGHVSPYAEAFEFWSRTDWGANRPMVDQVARIVGTEIRDTPRTALLRATPEHERTARKLVGNSPYVVIAPEGSWHGSGNKLYSQDQVRAVVRACHGRAEAVLCHFEPLHYRDTGALDLCGKTSLDEFVALVACAKAVVSTDTGSAHLAGAFNKPLLCATGPSINPYCIALDYLPSVFLKAPLDVKNNDPALLRQWTSAVLDVADARVCMVAPDRWPCGVVDVARRLSAALGCDLRTWDDDLSDVDAVVCQYHPADSIAWSKWRRRWGDVPRVWDVHKPDELPADGAPCIVHWTQYAGNVPGHRTRFIPLPTWEVPAEQWGPRPGATPRVIAWHGMVREHKGLEALVRVFEQQVRPAVPDAELRLYGTTGPRICDPALVSWLRGLRVDGLTVDLREEWSQDELQAALAEADVYVYLDTPESGREQSACSPAVLGFKRPVVVSESSCHQDLQDWTRTAHRGAEGDALVELLTSAPAYAQACQWVEYGAEFRSPELVAQQYRGMAQQAMLNDIIKRGV